MLILKGEGVEYNHPEMGAMRVHFPSKDNPYQDDYSHFHLDPQTGEPIQGLIGKWPLEGAAYRTAARQVQLGKFTSIGAALEATRKMFNDAVLRFNDKMRQIDPHHVYPYPVFSDDGSLNPALRHNHYSPYYGGPKVPMDERPVNDANGKTFTATINNKPHPRHGFFPEVPTLPFFKELQEEFKMNGINTSMGQYPYLKPEHFLVDREGNSNHRRYPRMRNRDPMPDNQRGKDLGNISLGSLFSLLPTSFYQPTKGGGRSGDEYKQRIREMTGLPVALLERMVRTDAGALLHERNAFRNSDNRFTKRMRDIQNQMQAAPGQANREKLDVLASRFSKDPNWKGTDSSHAAAEETMATLIMAREAGLNLDDGAPPPSPEIVRGFEAFVEGYGGSNKPYDMEQRIDTTHKPTQAPVRDMGAHAPHVSFAHGAPVQMRQPVPDMEEEPVVREPAPPVRDEVRVRPPTIPPPVAFDQPRFEQPKFALPPMDVRTSTDSLFDLMEQLQMAEAELDGILIKSSGVVGLAQNHNLSQQDILAIQHGVGNWETLAKALSIPYDVVRAVKVASR